jgi:PPOX class probable F420-dependent enzyme
MIDWNSEFGRAVKQHMQDQYVVWLTTVDTKLVPQPRPVWFIWDDNSFLIFSKPDAHKVKHIAGNPNVALHFNTDDTGDRHVMILTGEAALDVDCPPAHRVPAYLKKYESGIIGLDMTPESFSTEYSTAIRIKPANLRGWE